MENLKYIPLSPVHDQIRIIKLLPGVYGSQIYIELANIEVELEPEYEALSYVWGCPDHTQTIHVAGTSEIPNSNRESRVRRLWDKATTRNRNGENDKRTASLGVAENLFIALQHLRLDKEPRLLWIDAICINQNDLSERNGEVNRMGSIYHNAKCVIVWLGPAYEDSHLAMQMLRLVADGIESNPEGHLLTARSDSWPGIWGDKPETLVLHRDFWLAVWKLLHRTWFSRLWVYQEILLARNAALVAGNEVLDWKSVTVALRWIWASDKQLDRAIEGLDLQTYFSADSFPFLQGGSKPNSKSLLRLLADTRQLACLNPRDRLYAIRSLAIPRQSRFIIPDYSLSVQAVFTGFAINWLKSCNDANLFVFAGISSLDPSSKSPSWVPRFPKTRSYLFEGQSAGASQTFISGIDHSLLKIQGVLAATITSVTSTVNADSFTSAEKASEICKSWHKILRGPQVSLENLNMEDSFIDMLVYGRTAERKSSLKSQAYINRENIREYLANTYKTASHIEAPILYYLRNSLSDSVFVTTSSGDGGVCPPETMIGDCVAVVLGCYYPLIMRPDSSSGQVRYQIVGRCYISGIMYGEAFLGPFTDDWRAVTEAVEGEDITVFTKNSGSTVTQQDPRVPLPPAWRYRYGDQDDPYKPEVKMANPIRRQWFENVETGERSWYDPRLTPEELRKRGINIEELHII